MITLKEVQELGWILWWYDDDMERVVFQKDLYYMDVNFIRKTFVITIGYQSFQGTPTNIVFSGYLHTQEDLVMLQHMIKKPQIKG